MARCAAVISAITAARTSASTDGTTTSSATAPAAAAAPATRCHDMNPLRAASCGVRRAKWFAM